MKLTRVIIVVTAAGLLFASALASWLPASTFEFLPGWAKVAGAVVLCMGICVEIGIAVFGNPRTSKRNGSDAVEKSKKV